jgi:hypothetical protein
LGKDPEKSGPTPILYPTKGVLEKVVDVNSQGGFYGNVFRAARAKRPREGGLGAAGEGRRRLRLSGHDGNSLPALPHYQ